MAIVVYEDNTKLSKDSLNENFEEIFNVLNSCYSKIEELNQIDIYLKNAEKKIDEINSALNINGNTINDFNERIKPYENNLIIIKSKYQDVLGKHNVLQDNFNLCNEKMSQINISGFTNNYYKPFMTEYNDYLSKSNDFNESSLTVNELASLRSSELENANNQITSLSNFGTNFRIKSGITKTNNFITSETENGLFGKIKTLNTSVTNSTSSLGDKITGQFSALTNTITGDTGFGAIKSQISGVTRSITGTTGLNSMLSTINGNITGVTSNIVKINTNLNNIKSNVNDIDTRTSGFTETLDIIKNDTSLLSSTECGLAVLNSGLTRVDKNVISIHQNTQMGQLP